CHKFAHETKCKAPEERRRFCIDRYEYPNQKGGHPIWMLTWFQAQATCKKKSKRLCWASEWTAACEGAEHTPFPYGWDRNHFTCNIDNQWIDPIKRGNFLFYSKDKDVATKELLRLDQSVPSGSLADCKSGPWGHDAGDNDAVYDMTGNMDEWVISD